MRKLFILGAAAIALSAVPAVALIGPMPVIDVSANANLATQITKQITQVEQGAQQVQQGIQLVKGVEQNLKTLPTSYQNVEGEVAAIAGTGRTISAEVAGLTASTKVVANSSEEAAETNRLNGMASRALGANQQATVTNGYLSQQTNLLEQGNVLQAQAQIQHAAEVRATAQGAADLGTTIQSATTTDSAQCVYSTGLALRVLPILLSASRC